MTNNDDRQQPTVVTIKAFSHHEPSNNHDFGSDMQDDDALALKMHYVSNAIDKIGFTTYYLKLFFLNGFGYAADSLPLLLSVLTQPQVAMQYQPSVATA